MATRIFLRDIQISSEAIGTPITLPTDESHYIAHVLRLRVGDRIELGDRSTGTIAAAQIVSIADRVTAELQEILQTSSNQAGPLVVLVALCKGSKNEQICDWATELGCTEIIFWQATRSVVRLREPKDCSHKQSRLEKIALAAAQQSKQAKPPTVRVFASLEEALNTSQASFQESLKLTCSLSTDARPISEVIHVARDYHGKVLVIGPEGDLTSQEEELLSSRGFQRVSLGTSVLRSELAVVTALISAR